MANLFQPSLSRATDANGNSFSGAELYFYATGTLTPATWYTDAGGIVPGTNPLVANSAGVFAPAYLDPDITYRIVLQVEGVTVWDVDPVRGFDESQLAQASADAVAAAETSKAASTAAQAAQAVAEERAAFIEDSVAATPYATWAELDAETGMTAGDAAVIFDDDGTHTDPVTAATVDNAGLYKYRDPDGWERIADASEAARQAGIAADAAEAAQAVLNLQPGYTDASGYLDAWIDANGRTIYGPRTNGRFYAFGKRLAFSDELPSATDLAAYDRVSAMVASPLTAGAYAYGDSLTAGTGSTGGSTFPAQLATLAGIGVSNKGIGGQTSTQIGMRAGLLQIRLTVSGNSIPAGTTPVSVTAINGQTTPSVKSKEYPEYRFLSTLADNTTRSATGTIRGVHGTITRTVVSGDETYSWTSDSGEPAVGCPPGSIFVPDDAATSLSQPLIIWAGRNDYPDPEQVKDAIGAMMRAATSSQPTHRPILLLGVINGAGEDFNSTAYGQIIEINNYLRERYPENYAVDDAGLDVREALVAAYDSGEAQDVTDYNGDVVPDSLRADTVHLTNDGYAVVARVCDEHLARVYGIGA